VWPPSSAEDLERFLQTGDPEETHYVDFKREVSDKHARRSVAEHLASFATDGGWLVVGVDEPEPGRFVPAPLPLAGEPERIESIAHSWIDPLLQIEVTALDRGDGTGYVLVRIPPSPHVVHAVDHAYWGRGDKRKVKLDDVEVDRRVRLRHSQVDRRHAELRNRFDAYLSVNPTGSVKMLVRASPRTAHPRPLWSLTQPYNDQEIMAVVHEAEKAYVRAFIDDGARSSVLASLMRQYPRPGGRGLASDGVTAEGRLDDTVTAESSIAELRILESGAVETWLSKPQATGGGLETSWANDDDVVEVAAFTDRRRATDPRRYPGSQPYEASTTFTSRRGREALSDVTADAVGSFLRAMHTYGRFFPTQRA